MTLHDRLAALLELADPEGSVLLTCRWLREQLAAENATQGAAQPAQTQLVEADLTVNQVAELLARGPSTIRTWLAAHEFPAAYRLHGREWRIPRSDIIAFQKRQSEDHRRSAEPEATDQAADASDADLSSWRNHVRKPA